MTKSDLILGVAENSNVTKAEAKKQVEAVLQVIKEKTLESKKLVILGFGTFSQTERKARAGRNPQTGEAIEIPAKVVTKFKGSF